MTEITDLPAASALAGTELIAILQGGDAATVTTSAFTGFSQSGTGAVARTVQDKLRESVSVKDFGAVGDGVADDTAAFQAAINAAIAAGKALSIPAGRYVINAPLTAALPSAPAIGGALRFGIHGEGGGQVVLLYGGSPDTYCLSINGPAWGSAGMYSQLYVGGITFNGQNLTRHGMSIKRVIDYYVEDCKFIQNDLGHFVEDVVAGRYVACKFDFNYRGMLGLPGATAFVDNSGSPPNILTFVGCNAANNRQFAYWFQFSANIVFVGGSLESNGRTGAWTTISKTDRWDIRISEGGYNGGSALSMFGTHFETSAGDAFIRIEHTNTPATYLFSGCDFIMNGFDFGSGAQWVDNCIKFATNGSTKARVVVHACSFNGVNSYTASASRRVVAEGVVSGANHKFMLSGNNYWSDTDAPSSTLPREEFERGSNANGEYIRYPDGTQICTNKVVISSGGTATWSFPVAFAVGTEPSVTATPVSGGLPRFVTTGSNFNTSAAFWGFDDAGAGANVSFYATATGRWFA